MRVDEKVGCRLFSPYHATLFQKTNELCCSAGLFYNSKTIIYLFNIKFVDFQKITKKVADRSPLPIIIHNIPAVSYIDLPAEFLVDIASHPNIVGVKECSHNVSYLLKY